MKFSEDFVDFDNAIIPWLGKTSKIIDYYFHEDLKKHNLDLSKEQVIVLKKLHQKNGLNQNELAFLTLRNKSTLTRLLSKMEAKNYIKRKRSNEDKRISHVFLTDKGRAVYKKTIPVLKNCISFLENGITVEEKQIAIKILKKIQYNITLQKEPL
ncbi:MarR family transcriptional regulator [uncultured Maribacter sp.]|uniref:MarR family winged helix-turn-helix transcriptional regulator n=1 Tax=uncultured Maribacter sp. TaxID=431308 RepID=UPI0026094AF5|nr:MarR family transcriptional regulator [uncultured Maribacter sp.]